MGELLLCSGSAAAVPYYMDGVSVNLYSLEELCYYIANNVYLLDKDSMGRELCSWIGKEAKNPALSERLKGILDSNGKMSSFVREILLDCGYYGKREIEEILQTVMELEEKSEFECNKLRADRLLEKEKYLSSIYEYNRLLDSREAQQASSLLLGDIWHNLGTAYARMFLFEDAIACYKKAYYFNQREESLRARLFAYWCMQDEEGFQTAAKENHLDDMGIQAVRNELAMCLNGEIPMAFREKLQELQKLLDAGEKTLWKQEIGKIVYKWKEDYRRISRV